MYLRISKLSQSIRSINRFFDKEFGNNEKHHELCKGKTNNKIKNTYV